MFIIVHAIIVSEIFPVHVTKGWIYDFLCGSSHSSGLSGYESAYLKHQGAFTGIFWIFADEEII